MVSHVSYEGTQSHSSVDDSIFIQNENRSRSQESVKKVSGSCSCFRDKCRISLFPKDATPLPKRDIFIVCFALFASTYSVVFPFPFLPELVLQLGYKEEDKGRYVGQIASAMFVGRIFGSFLWGWLTDKWGRRPVMLICSLANGIVTLSFGFTDRFWIAILTRFMTGVVNGVVGTGKTIMYDISDSSNQAIGMSLMSMSWGFAYIVAPTFGGVLADPCRKYYSTFGDNLCAEDALHTPFLRRFPNIMSCTIGCFLGILATILVFFFLPETKPGVGRSVKKSTRSSSDIISLAQINEEVSVKSDEGKTDVLDSLLSNQVEAAQTTDYEVKRCHKTLDSDNYQEGKCRQRTATRDVTSMEDLRTFEIAASKSMSLNDLSSLELSRLPSVEEHSSVSDELSFSKKETRASSNHFFRRLRSASVFVLLRNPTIIRILIVSMLFSFASIGWDDILPVYSSTVTYRLGLGMSSTQIGLILGCLAVPVMILQILFFTRMERRFGVIHSLQFCMIVILVCCSLSTIPRMAFFNDILFWFLIIIVLVPARVTLISSFTSIAILLNNSVPPTNVGTVNGLNMALASIMRSLAPLFAGNVFSWTVKHGYDYGPPLDISLVFFLFGFVFFCAVLVTVTLPTSLNRQSFREGSSTLDLEEKVENSDD